MRVLLTSAGLETEEIKECFVDMAGKDMSDVKALFIPTAAIDPDAIEVLPKCMNDLLKCGVLGENIDVFDLHTGMELEKLSNMMWYIYAAEIHGICWKESMLQGFMTL